GGAGAARDVAGGMAMGGAAAGGGRRSSGGGLRAVGSGGAPAAPLLQLPPVRARREQVRLATMFLHFDQPPFVHDGFILWHARSVQPIEDCRSPGVDGYSEEGGSDEQAGEGPSAESEQQEQVRRVVEREAEPELVVPAVLVEKAGDGHQRGGQPERAVQARLLARPEQIKEQRRGDEEAHAFAVEADPQGVELDLRQARERVVQVAFQKSVVEEAVAADLRVDAVVVEMRVAELAEAAESGLVHPGRRDRNRNDGGAEED